MIILLSVVVPLIVLCVIGFISLRLSKRLQPQSTSVRDPKALRRWFGRLLPVVAIGLIALVYSIANLVGGARAPGIFVLLAAGLTLGVGGTIVGAVLWSRMADYYRSGPG